MSKKPVVPISKVDITEMEIEMAAFLEEMKKTTNKAAAIRARKTSMKIEKLMKAFRYNSIK